MAGITPKTSEHSRVTVGIVTYNSSGQILECLNSIAANLRDAIPTVVILDNASTDDTRQIINQNIKKFPFPITLIPSTSNKGYAWGANRICEIAQTDWICLINPDAKIFQPVFEHAKNLVRMNPTCGVIGGIITDSEGNPQECGGVFPTPTMAMWDWCGLRHIFPRSSWSTTIRLNLPPSARPKPIDYPTGAFWMLRREVYQRVGPFDEQFFLYFEETDFCKRAKQKGWPSYIHPAIRIEHIKGASFPEYKEAETNSSGNDEADEADDGSLAAGNRSQNIDPLTIYFESLVKYLYKHFTESRVRRSLLVIHNFLKFRKWVRKDSKSERLLMAFERGKSSAEDYIESIKPQQIG